MESVFENLAKREEDEDLFKLPSGGIVRFIQPPEYQIVINQFQNIIQTYQFQAPAGRQDRTLEANGILLRLKISNTGIVSLIQKFTIHQAGNLQGIDAYTYMINNEGVGAVLELILPWDKNLQDHINV